MGKSLEELKKLKQMAKKEINISARRKSDHMALSWKLDKTLDILYEQVHKILFNKYTHPYRNEYSEMVNNMENVTKKELDSKIKITKQNVLSDIDMFIKDQVDIACINERKYKKEIRMVNYQKIFVVTLKNDEVMIENVALLKSDVNCFDVDLTGDLDFNTDYKIINIEKEFEINSLEEVYNYCIENNISIKDECKTSEGLIVGGGKDFIINKNLKGEWINK